MATQELVLHDERAVEQSRFMPVMSIDSAVSRREVIVMAVKKLMNANSDFGTIPGTPKPTLYQPGADKLNNLFGLVPRFEIIEKQEDWTGERHGSEPFFAYTVKCKLFRGDYLMGEGDGSCNSWESKYRYRKSERCCPKCGKDSIIKGKVEYGGGWLCYVKKAGCGSKFKEDDPAISGQQVGRVANPDIFDLVNTVLKMANKRAKIAATLNATSAHEFFTQDVEDIASLQRDAETIDIGDNQVGTKAAANYVAEQKINGKSPHPAAPSSIAVDPPPAASSSGQPQAYASIKARLAQFSQIKDGIGKDMYYAILGGHGFEHANEIPTLNKARDIYREMAAELKRQEERINQEAPAPEGM